MVFPPGQEVLIEVRYILEGTGEYPFISFAYLLETGAGWKDTIGSAEVTLRLPYDISVQNVFINSGPGWGDTSQGRRFRIASCAGCSKTSNPAHPITSRPHL